MKRKFLVLGLVFTLSFTSLCGCGKDDDSDKHHESSDTETSSQDGSYEGYSGEESDSEACDSDEDSDNALSDYVAPTQEILDADFTDFKFQIEDTVVTLKPGDTVEELMDQLSDDFYLNVSDEGDITTSWLVGGEEQVVPHLMWSNGDRSFIAFILWVDNLSSDDCELGECIITSFHLEGSEHGNTYLAKGIPYDVPGDDRLSYENIKDTLEEFGAQDNGDELYLNYDGIYVAEYAGKVVIEDRSDEYHYYIYVFADDPYPEGSGSYPVYEMEIDIDQETHEAICDLVKAYVFK